MAEPAEEISSYTKIGRQYFTTLSEVNAMMEKCACKHRASSESNDPGGLKGLGNQQAALARLTAMRLKKRPKVGR